MNHALTSRPLVTRQQIEADMDHYRNEKTNWNAPHLKRMNEKPGMYEAISPVVSAIFLGAVFGGIVWGLVLATRAGIGVWG